MESAIKDTEETNDMNETENGENINSEKKNKEKREDLADRLVNAMAANWEKAMLIDDDERLRLEREREKRIDALPYEPSVSDD